MTSMTIILFHTKSHSIFPQIAAIKPTKSVIRLKLQLEFKKTFIEINRETLLISTE